MSISFHSLHLTQKITEKNKIRKWISEIISAGQRKAGTLNFIFVSDDYLLEINREYLKHDFLTDIVTFNFNEGNSVSGDIYISVERVQENAVKYKVNFEQELLRVIIHGIFHLLGFEDHSKEDKSIMRKLEDKALEQYRKI